MAEQGERRFRSLIIGGSIIIPLVVAILYFSPRLQLQYDFSFLPPFYASINGLTAIVLVLGWLKIKKGNIIAHRRLMSFAIILSIVFLLSYILYHLTTDSTPYGGEGMLRSVYFFILISHILLSILIIPLVLIAFTRALAEKYDKHKKIAKITLPLWLYVAVTGVVVYVMISPYYP